ncbi:MAG: 1-hydroxy-2-methyl-2-butenyl 4-diphosphate reductase [Solirubrobacterales bacterium]
MSRLLIAAPMRVEALLIRWGASGARVHTTGMGPQRSRAAARALLHEAGDALMVVGFCGGLDAQSVPGEVVIAEEVSAASDEDHAPERVPCAGAPELAAAMARRGLRVRTGPVVSVSRLALGERRAQLRAGGAIAVDMESAWLAAGAGGRPFGVVRVVLDSPTHELFRPQAAAAAVRAARVLRHAASAALHEWGPGG